MTTGARLGSAGLLALARLQGCAAGEKRSRTPSLGRSVVAVNSEIEGVSFSTDGAPYARFTDFIDREECLVLSVDEVARIIDHLEREGFFKEKNRGIAGEVPQGASRAVPYLRGLPRPVEGMPLPVREGPERPRQISRDALGPAPAAAARRAVEIPVAQRAVRLTRGLSGIPELTG
jgi:hypothetical protein